MYVLGGFDGNATADVLKLDITQGTWSRVAPMPEIRYAFAACAVGTDIYVFGGSAADNQPQASVYKLDILSNAWSTLAPMPRACEFPSASVLEGLVYIVGVEDGREGRDVLCFDPIAGVWSTLASTLHSRRSGASFVVGRSLYVAGGVGTTSSVERYDVASNTWTAVADMLEGRIYFSALAIGSAGPAEEQDLFDSLIAEASRRRT